MKQSDLTEWILTDEYVSTLNELRDMRDFVLLASAPKRISGEYSCSREVIEAKAKSLLDKYDL